MSLAEILGGNYTKGTVVEFELGPNDILVINSLDRLPDKVIANIRETVDAVLAKDGRQCIVLSDGMTATVIHRS